MRHTFLALLAVVVVAPALHAQVRITEWMYNTNEFVEFTNLGSSSVDLTGWSFSDSARGAGDVSLSAFGTLAAGESVILSEAAADTFRATWNLPASVKIIGGNAQNLSRSDEINIYNASGELQDRLTYNDQTGLGPRTDTASAWISFSNVGTNNANLWTRSTVGDAQGSYLAGGAVANPGTYAVPEPGTYALIGLGLGLVIWQLRRRSIKA